MQYTVAIRTLGKGGEYYQRTLDSLMLQTLKPAAIIVYIAEGYAIPKETVGFEQYVYVKKGMVAQRALSYDEVQTEYILFLDDDVYLPPNGVETLFRELQEKKAQVIAPCLFANHKVSIKSKIRLAILGREVCRSLGRKWGYKVLRTAGFSYKNQPKKNVYESQTNAGPCFLCKKADFLSIRFEEELWLDEVPYAFPDDQVMFYKMYRCGLKQLTSFDSGIIHQDASSTVQNQHEKTVKLIYSEYRNKLIFWHRFLFKSEKNPILKGWSVLCIAYVYAVQLANAGIRFMRGQNEEAKAYFQGTQEGITFLKSKNYKSLSDVR